MGEISKLTGREYHLFNYYGAEDAENIIIIMGSASETVRTVVEKLNAEGKKVGVLVVHLYRPFSIEHFMGAIPQSVKRIAVLDRTKEPGAFGEPLYLYKRKNQRAVGHFVAHNRREHQERTSDVY